VRDKSRKKRKNRAEESRKHGGAMAQGKVSACRTTQRGKEKRMKQNIGKKDFEGPEMVIGETRKGIERRTGGRKLREVFP